MEQIPLLCELYFFSYLAQWDIFSVEQIPLLTNRVHIKKSPDNKIFQNKLFYTYIKRQKSDNLYAKCDCIFYSLLF